MNWKHYLLFLLFLSTTSLAAQQIVPLEFNDQLKSVDKGDDPGLAKNNCTFSLDDFLLVTAGDSLSIQIEVDTVGFPTGSGFSCLNCASLEFGTLRLDDDGYTYFADPGVEQGIENLDLAFCNAAGDSCTVTEQVTLLVQRESRTFSFASQTLGPEERTEVVVPADELPGGLFCRRFVDCEDDYEGSGQETLFLFNQSVSNDFRYESARLAGTDLVCLELCNEFGLCDQYIYSFDIIRDRINLPFFDDFSRTAQEPDTRLWQNEDVLINRTYPIDPPSLGVATFDALGPRGQPYPEAGSIPVPRDFLTSAAINMNGISDAVLIFYAQPRGLGNRPETQDSLVLQFREEDGDWRNIWSLPGLATGESNCSDRPFIGYRIEVPAEFAYDGFQFRFFNLSNQVGALDHWHLDYVRLDNVFTELNQDDIALMVDPLPITTPYSSLPYRQLVAGGEALIRQEVEVAVWNHAGLNPFLPANQSSYQIDELNTTTPLLPQIFFSVLNEIPRGVPFVAEEDLSALTAGLYTNYREGLLGLPNEADSRYRVRNFYNISNETFTEVEVPGITASVRANNQAFSITDLSDYYAYDDGTAELAIEALPGQMVVQSYVAYTPEVLRGVSIRLPRTTEGNADQRFRLVVFTGELVDNEPDYSIEVAPIYVEDFFQDSLNGFTSYAFPEPIDLPADTFYVGWQQIGTCTDCIPVGLDRNTILEGTRFFNNGGLWFEFGGCSTGALMVRPLVGDGDVPITNLEDLASGANELGVAVYPNPARDQIQLAGAAGVILADLEWQLLSVTGAMVHQGKGGGTITVSQLPAGWYVLRVVDPTTGRQAQFKIVLEP